MAGAITSGEKLTEIVDDLKSIIKDFETAIGFLKSEELPGVHVDGQKGQLEARLVLHRFASIAKEDARAAAGRKEAARKEAEEAEKKEPEIAPTKGKKTGK